MFSNLINNSMSNTSNSIRNINKCISKSIRNISRRLTNIITASNSICNSHSSISDVSYLTISLRILVLR